MHDRQAEAAALAALGPAPEAAKCPFAVFRGKPGAFVQDVQFDGAWLLTMGDHELDQ